MLWSRLGKGIDKITLVGKDLSLSQVVHAVDDQKNQVSRSLALFVCVWVCRDLCFNFLSENEKDTICFHMQPL